MPDTDFPGGTPSEAPPPATPAEAPHQEPPGFAPVQPDIDQPDPGPVEMPPSD